MKKITAKDFKITAGSMTAIPPDDFSINYGLGGSGDATITIPGVHSGLLGETLTISDGASDVFSGTVSGYTLSTTSTTLHVAKPGVPGTMYFGHAASGLFAYGSGGPTAPKAGRDFAEHLDMDQFFVDEFIRGIREGRIEV
jgi:hypothetical protein